MIEAVLSASSILERLSSIEVPIIIDGGAGDPALQMSASRDIHQQINNATSIEISQCDPSSLIEQPDRFINFLQSFQNQQSQIQVPPHKPPAHIPLHQEWV